ncbi:MAG: oligosaccharide flippase family protein [Patescibacteria group bacterium]
MNAVKARFVSLLRWSEQYTKTDMVYLASGGSWILFGYMVQIVSGLGLAIAFANLLPKEVFGTYQFILSGAAIVSVFTLTGMGGAIARAAANGSEGSLRYGFRTQIIWSSGIVLAAAIGSLYYHINGNALLGNGFLIVGALQPFITGFSLYKSFLQGKQLFRESVILETTQRLVSFIVLLAALFTTNDPLVLVSVYLLSNAASLSLTYLFVVRKYAAPLSADPALKNYGKHLSVMESFAEVANVIDKVLVWVFLGAAPLAAYVIAQLPVMHLQNLFGFMRILMFPKLAQKDFSEIIQILPEKIRLYSLMALLVVGAYVLAAPFLFGLLFPAYPESALYSQILALSVLAIPRTLIGQAFLAHQKKRELYIMNISTPMVRVALLALFLWIWGIWGAIAAILITELYAALLQWHLFRTVRAIS